MSAGLLAAPAGGGILSRPGHGGFAMHKIVFGALGALALGATYGLTRPADAG
jgi:hypothetical protein